MKNLISNFLNLSVTCVSFRSFLMRSNVFIASAFIAAFSIFSCAGHAEPGSDLVIKNLIKSTAEHHDLSGPAEKFITNPEYLFDRVERAADQFVFNKLHEELNPTLLDGKKNDIEGIVYNMAKKSIPFPLNKDGTYNTDEASVPTSLLELRLAQIRKALVEVMTEISLRTNLSNLIKTGTGRVTIEDSQLPSLGMWLYLQLIALHVAHSDYDFVNPRNNVAPPPSKLAQFFTKTNLVNRVKTDTPKLVFTIMFILTRDYFGPPGAAFFSWLAGSIPTEQIIKRIGRKKTTPTNGNEGDHTAPTSLLYGQGENTEGRLGNDGARDTAKLLALDRLRNNGSPNSAPARFFLDAKIHRGDNRGDGSDSLYMSIQSLVQDLSGFKHGPCANSLNEGSFVFAETRVKF